MTQTSTRTAPGEASQHLSLHVTGHLAPVADEIDAVALHVEGALPPELTGRLLRNRPTRCPASRPVTGSPGRALVHGIRLENGAASWFLH